jgi:Flp pilus assembly CpaE family ATPase
MDEPRPRVILALIPAVERAIEPLLFGQTAPLRLVASIAEADELERQLDAGHQAVLVSPRLPGLSAGHCTRARAAGLRLVGVALDDQDAEELQALGVDATVDSEATAEQLLVAIVGEPVAAAERQPLEPITDRAAERNERAGTIVAAVGGGAGAGASEVIGSFGALAATRWPALLVELDALAGGLGLRLAADPGQGSLAAVARALESGERDPSRLLEQWLVRRPGWPALLPLADHSEETLHTLAEPGAVRRALDALAERVPLVFVDVGFLLQAGGELPAVCRIHREAVVSADAIVLVLGAREPQLDAGLRQLDLLLGPLDIPPGKLRIVCNGLGGPGAAETRGLKDGLQQRLATRELTVDCWLPFDARALRIASRDGLPLASARRRGRYTKALRGFLNELFLPTAPVARERKRKLAVSEPPPDEEVPLPWRN